MSPRRQSVLPIPENASPRKTLGTSPSRRDSTDSKKHDSKGSLKAFSTTGTQFFKKVSDDMSKSIGEKLGLSRSPGSRKSKRSSSNMILDLLQNVNLPKRIPEWNPKQEPLENEEDLRFFLRRKKERREEEKKMREEEEQNRKNYTNQLERQTRASSAKGDGVLAVLMTGGYSFDSQGRPLAVRKLNVQKLPEIIPELDVGVDGQAVRKLADEIETTAAKKGRFQRRRATASVQKDNSDLAAAGIGPIRSAS